MMSQTESENSKKTRVFFDGFCNLCNRSVDWLILRDSQNKLLFTSLQGETAKRLLSKTQTENLSSIVVITPEGLQLRESLAVFYLLRMIRSPWRALRIFQIFPRFLTDAVYRWIARNRFRLFGRRDSCRIPTPEESKKFLP